MILRFFLAVVTTVVLASAVPARHDDPDSEAIRVGNESYLRGQYRLAIYEYRQIGSHSERYAEAEYNIGVCHYALGEIEEALTHYAIAIQIRKGRYPIALYAQGVAFEDLGRRVEAKDAFLRAANAPGEKHAGALFKLGLVYQRERDYRAAVFMYRKALTRAQQFPACHNNLGVVLALEGRYGDAEHEFAIALKESNGKFEDARQNIELCRTLLVAASREVLARLVSSESIVIEWSGPR